jgi:hypothetical protein
MKCLCEPQNTSNNKKPLRPLRLKFEIAFPQPKPYFCHSSQNYDQPQFHSAKIKSYHKKY